MTNRLSSEVEPLEFIIQEGLKGNSRRIESRIIGPGLPDGYLKQEPGISGDSPEETSQAVAAIRPELPQDSHQSTGSVASDRVAMEECYAEGGDEETLETIGPLVSEMNHGDEVVQAAEEFERRSRKMKEHLTIKAEAEPGPSKREEWMTELPPEMGKNFGLTGRTFSKGGGPENKDRSEWTDTPVDKIKKEKESKSKKRKRDEVGDKTAPKRDQQLQQQVDDYNKKKRPESLVEMHQKQKKKKKKKEKKKEKDKKKEKKNERRAFDRDKDLKVNQFDDAQRKAIIKRSQVLNTRFTHSHTTSSFL